MSCACLNKKRSSELRKVRDLATKAAKMEGVIYVICKNADGTFSFTPLGTEKNEIVEYIHYL